MGVTSSWRHRCTALVQYIIRTDARIKECVYNNDDDDNNNNVRGEKLGGRAAATEGSRLTQSESSRFESEERKRRTRPSSL